MNGDSADKSVKKQRVWKKDMLRIDDFSKMKEMVAKLRKHRQNESKTTGITNNGGDGGAGGLLSVGASGAISGKSGAGKSVPARTSIQQT